jgi:hypothetical protein
VKYRGVCGDECLKKGVDEGTCRGQSVVLCEPDSSEPIAVVAPLVVLAQAHGGAVRSAAATAVHRRFGRVEHLALVVTVTVATRVELSL